MSGDEQIGRLEGAVLDGSLRGVVDHVARPLDDGRFRVTGAGGCVTWTTDGDAVVEGDDPVANQDPGHLLTAEEQRRSPHPDAEDNAFPHALDNLTQFFDAVHAPDAVVLPHPRQRLDGILGHHGGLGVVQARAPFLAAGAGITARGMVDEHLRMVDVAPTLVALAGGAPLAVQDGRVADGLVTGPVDHVVVFLLDGTNPAALWAAVEEGAAPTIAALVDEGTAYRHGLLASLPTATLANHTTALTGASPGHSGILHHTWHDRGRDETVDLLAVPAMFRARRHLAPGVETVHEAVHRGRPGSVTACTYEFVDRGADWSTFAHLDEGRHLPWPTRDEVAAASSPSLLAHEECAFMSQVDTASAQQARDRFSGRDHDLPAFCWVNLNVTDAAGHAAGPHSDLARDAIVDSDRRVADVLAAVDDARVRDRTAVVVMADHGMQEAAHEPPRPLDPHLGAPSWKVVDHLLAYATT